MLSLPFLPGVDGSVDPNLFALKWDQVFEVLMAVVILSFFQERGLALLFESPTWLNYEARKKSEHKGDAKPLIAFVIGALICLAWQMDAVSVILSREHTTLLGCVLTGAVVAGGCKASLKLFHDTLGVYTSSYKQAKEEMKQMAALAPTPPTPPAGEKK